MTTTIAAIETSYAGCRFRSRLEARWAVFLDSLSVPWRYEPQGYVFGPDQTPYLPDFWLPNLGLWVEVKGKLEHRDLETLIWACSGAGLPVQGPDSPDRCTAAEVWPYRARMLLLGEIPAPGEAWAHTRLDVVGDLVVAQPVVFQPGLQTFQCFPPIVLNGYVAGKPSTDDERARILDAFEVPWINPFQRVTDAYKDARSARFEHGQSGA